MKIVYVEGGPDIIRMGAMQFRRGEAKEVPDDIAKRILAKKNVRFEAEKPERDKPDKPDKLNKR